MCSDRLCSHQFPHRACTVSYSGPELLKEDHHNLWIKEEIVGIQYSDQSSHCILDLELVYNTKDVFEQIV